MGQPAAVGVDARARECGAHRRCFEAYQNSISGTPSGRWSSHQLFKMPVCSLLPPTTVVPNLDHVLVCPLHASDGRAPHPPVACAIAASKRGSCARRPSSRLAARSSVFARAHADDRRRDTRRDRMHDGHTSRAAACSSTRRCQPTAQSISRRLVRQAPRTASLSAMAVTSGRQCAR